MTLHESPLHAAHQALGAKLVPFGGWDMPLQYPSGTLAEHRACRTSAVAFDVSHLGTVRVTGPDAFDRLQAALTNDLGKVGPGRAQYTHLLDEADASVLDDIIVWWVDDERFDVMPNASNTDRVVAALGAGAVDVTAERAIIALQGPQARALLAPVSPEAAAIGRFHVGRFTWNGIECVVAGTGYTGEDGVEVAVPAEHAPALLGRRPRRRASSRRGWAPATRCASKRGCPSTATSWARASPRCRPASAGWSAGPRARSGGATPWPPRRSGAWPACCGASRSRGGARPEPTSRSSSTASRPAS